MSNEISYVANLAVERDGLTTEQKSLLRQSDQSGSKFTRGRMSATTTAKLIDLGEITSPNWISIENLSSTVTIYLYTGLAGAEWGKVSPGKAMVMELGNNTTPAVKTTTSTASFSYLVCEA